MGCFREVGSQTVAIATNENYSDYMGKKAIGKPPSRRHASLSNARAKYRPLGHDVVDWGPAYLAALEQSGRRNASAQLAGVTLRSVQRRRAKDPEFADAEKAAMEVVADLIEDEITRRAIEGVEEPVFGSGGPGVGTVQVGTIRKYSDTLLLRLAERTETRSWRPRQEVVPVSDAVSFLSMTRAERQAKLEAAKAECAKPL